MITCILNVERGLKLNLSYPNLLNKTKKYRKRCFKMSLDMIFETLNYHSQIKLWGNDNMHSKGMHQVYSDFEKESFV